MKKYGNARRIDATKETQNLLSIDTAKEAEEMREKEQDNSKGISLG